MRLYWDTILFKIQPSIPFSKSRGQIQGVPILCDIIQNSQFSCMLDYRLIILVQKAGLPKYPSICKWHVSQQGCSRSNSCKGQNCDMYFWQKHVIPSESLDHTTKTETLWKSLHTLSLYHHHRQRLQMHKGSLPVIDKSFIANRKPLITNVTHNKAPKVT